MKRKAITAGLVVLAVLFVVFVVDHFGAAAMQVEWGLVVGLAIVAVVVIYMWYLAFLKQSGNAANAEHDKRVAKRVPKVFAGGFGALVLVTAVLYFGPTLWGNAQAQAGNASSGLTDAFDATSSRTRAVLPPAWVMVAVPSLIVAAIVFIARGQDAESKTVRGIVVGLLALGSVIVALAGHA